ncbi:TniQ family protein [Cytobacillus oceanisediminis]|uniref:TniQ domain-containing protein n=1 Tax=Cytobacillus oceanisediminis 2691 TaxID=1196031 RepID=A0A160MEV9_9BACI|nr:TniQ family protein [Cytobacillus oceanisediminis]AND41443.1 hypothetical protein A361_20510 [Cytobacillus oceanisediminis 2691]
MKPLLNRVVGKKNESLYSLLFRAARENYYDHLGSMLKEIAATIYNTNCNYLREEYGSTHVFKELSRSLKLDVSKYILNKYDDILVDIVSPNGEVSSLFQSHRVYQKYHTKYCPECIKNDYYHRLDWDLSLITLCNEHKIKLIDVCPNCKRKILLGRFMADKCKCSFRFSATETIDKENEVMVLEAQKAIFNYLHGVDMQQFKNVSLTAQEYFFLFFYLCKAMDNRKVEYFTSFNHISQLKKLNFNGNKNIDSMRLMNTIAHFCIIDPFDYFHELLKCVDSLRKQKQDTYFRVANYLKKVINHPKGSIYQQAYDNYLNELTDENINQRYKIKSKLKEKKYVTRTEALKILNTEWKVILNLCQYNLLKQRIIKRKERTVKLIERESLERYIKMKEESLSLSALGRFIGANFYTTRGLVEKDIIMAEHGPGIEGYPIWYIRKERGEEFLNKLSNLAVEGINSINQEWISFEKVNTHLMCYEIKTVNLIELLLQNVFRFAFLRGSKKIKSIVINSQDVSFFINRKKIETVSSDGFSVRELVKILKMAQPTIEKKLNAGIISISNTKRNRNGSIVRYVSKETVMRFLMERNNFNETEAQCYIDQYIFERSNLAKRK